MTEVTPTTGSRRRLLSQRTRSFGTWRAVQKVGDGIGLSAVMLGLVACSGTSDVDWVSAGNQDDIRGGDLVESDADLADAFRSVVQISTDVDGLFVPVCTGTRVGRRTLLVAAHCVTGDASRIFGSGEKIWISGARNPGESNAIRAEVDSVLAEPSSPSWIYDAEAKRFVMRDGASDVALLRLKFELPSSIRIAEIDANRGALELDQLAVVGYGCENGPRDLRLRYALTAKMKTSEPLLQQAFAEIGLRWSGSVPWRQVADVFFATNEEPEGLGCSGDAGAPVFAARPSVLWHREDVIVGVKVAQGSAFQGQRSLFSVKTHANVSSSVARETWRDDDDVRILCEDAWRAGEVLLPGQSRCADNGHVRVTLESSGVLALYVGDRRVWSSGVGSPSGGSTQDVRGELSADGNIAVYRGSSVVWQTNTHGYPSAYLSVAATGELIFFDAGGGIIRRFPDAPTPTPTPTPTPAASHWAYSDWSVCSATCGDGEQTRTVSCRTDADNLPAPTVNCQGATQEPLQRACNEGECTTPTEAVFDWVTTPFSTCSAECGGGVRTRSVTCKDQQGNVSATACALKPKPAAQESCNLQACPEQTQPSWGFLDSMWSSCPATCGGLQTRAPACLLGTTRYADSACSAASRPLDQSRACAACPPPSATYRWNAVLIAACSLSCGGVQSYSVSCLATVNGVTSVVPDLNCANVPNRPADTVPCQACQWNLTNSQWSACSGTCGAETQTRAPMCVAPSAPTVPLAQSRCDPTSKPASEVRACSACTPVQDDALTAYLVRIYTAGLGRTQRPADSELNYWKGRITDQYAQSGDGLATMKRATKDLFLSAEYTNRNRTHTQYVTDLYNAILGHGPDTGGLGFWVGLLNDPSAPITRAVLIDRFMDTAEAVSVLSAIL